MVSQTYRYDKVFLHGSKNGEKDNRNEESLSKFICVTTNVLYSGKLDFIICNLLFSHKKTTSFIFGCHSFQSCHVDMQCVQQQTPRDKV